MTIWPCQTHAVRTSPRVIALARERGALSPEVEDTIRQMRAAGAKLCEISAATGWSEHTISLWALGMGLPSRAMGRRTPNELAARVCKLREEGLQYKQIAERVGMHPKTVALIYRRTRAQHADH